MTVGFFSSMISETAKGNNNKMTVGFFSSMISEIPSDTAAPIDSKDSTIDLSYVTIFHQRLLCSIRGNRNHYWINFSINGDYSDQNWKYE
jgi:hypothetical protein